MIGAIIGGALKVGGAIVGMISKAKAARKAARILSQQKAENQAWYDRRYNEDGTQRADAQRSMQMMRDAMGEHSKRATASAAVTGATDESLALQKEAGNRALSATTSNIAAQADERKDSIERQYLSRKAQLSGKSIDVEQNRGQAIGDAVSGTASAGSSIATGLSGLFK